MVVPTPDRFVTRGAPVKDVLIASDSTGVRNEVRAVLSAKEFAVREVSAGPEVLPAVVERQPDLVVCDMQMGAMGGMATCLELRLEAGAGRIGRVPVLLLLDRRADVFLGRRSDADGWLIKPLDPIRLRKAVTALLDGGTYFDTAYKPAESLASGR